MIDADVVATLLAPASCSVSIYLSAGSAEHDRRAPDARLRGLIEQADKRLERRSLASRPRAAILQPLRHFAESADFARHRDPCLALFVRWNGTLDVAAADPVMTVVPLPRMLPDDVAVGPDFHVKPLLPYSRTQQVGRAPAQRDAI